MNKKKIVFISFMAIIVLGLGLGVYYFLTKEDKNTTLNLLEKQWIESNKNKVIDLSIMNNLPVFGDSGEGVFFDFLTSLEHDTKLEFNKLPYHYGEEVKSPYAFRVTTEVKENDILLYHDSYALISESKVKYNRLDEIKGIIIGTLEEDLPLVNQAFKGTTQVSFQAFDDIDALLEAYEGKTVGAIALPQNLYLEQILTHEDYHIVYNITELEKNYVLTLGNTGRLNDILTKYYKKWRQEYYDDSYQKHFGNAYFRYREIDEKARVKFRSKRYSYGFVSNAPFDVLDSGKLIGSNNAFIKGFSNVADIEVSYQEYPSVEKMLEAINVNKLDFFMDMTANKKYEVDTSKTVSLYDEQFVIASPISYDIVLNSIASLSNIPVATIKGSKIEAYLTSQKIKVDSYDNMASLLNHLKKNTLLALDSSTYEYYHTRKLSNYRVDYQGTLNDSYTFLVRDIKDNEIFYDFFDFYLSFQSLKRMANQSYVDFVTTTSGNGVWKTLVVYGAYLILGVMLIILIFTFIFRPKKKKASLSKEDKLKYVDMLTSLKNRNYLNDNIERWDASEIYPQTIIIVDLNNVTYINDNYGHQEGDKVIAEAANILIRTQVENSDIIRTNGNEFLIYLVGYDEKQVVSYIRKLNKELKDLSHGFGAAVGYSVINDAIKTIDDAVNEATLDMRNNKEEANN